MTGMVAAGHERSAAAGADVLRAGGNAVDAALGALLTSFACEPLLTGLGAGGYLLAAGFDDEPVLLDFFVAAPGRGRPADDDRARSPALLAVDVDFGDAQQVFHVGAGSVGTWGMPAGVCEASRRWGSVALADLCAPAAALAREGCAVNAAQAYIGEILGGILVSAPSGAAVFAPAGRAHRAGEHFAWPELGDALERLGAEGHAPFYTGDVAAAIVDELERGGGSLTAEDLRAYEATARAPVHAGYRGRDVLTNPPPNAGGVLIAAALARLDAGATSAPELVDVMEAAQRARTEAFVDDLAVPGRAEQLIASRLGSTTHVSVVDADGRACAVTTSNGEGCGIVVGGVHPNNMMGEEDLNPLGFGRFEPGRRMPSMMAPTVVLAADSSVELVLGSAGSNRIRSAILQTIVGVVDRGLDATAAVEAPRLHFERGVVHCEPGIDVDALRAAGRDVATFRDRNLFFGGVQAVACDPVTGELSGAGDPRRGGVAVAA